MSDLNISSTQFCNFEDRKLELFLRKSRETASKASGIYCSSPQSVLGFDRDTSPFAQLHKNESNSINQEYVEAILLVLNAQSTYPKNGFLTHAETGGTKWLGALHCMKCVLRNFRIEKDQAERNC